MVTTGTFLNPNAKLCEIMDYIEKQLALYDTLVNEALRDGDAKLVAQYREGALALRSLRNANRLG